MCLPEECEATNPLSLSLSLSLSCFVEKTPHFARAQRFGENYIQELVEKCEYFSHPTNRPNFPDIKFSFIGTLQSNKVNKVIEAGYKTGLVDICETVATSKLAKKLNDAVVSANENANLLDGKLTVLVQVNTSGEESKGGCEPPYSDSVFPLISFILESCPGLGFGGLMTIGKIDDSATAFTVLNNVKHAVESEFGDSLLLANNEFTMSMGMSGDFVEAIEHGATSIRVGSSIFGVRDYPK